MATPCALMCPMRCQHCILAQHQSRETTEYQSNFVIVTLVLEFRCSSDNCSGTVKAMAFGCEFSPVVLVLFARLKRSGSPTSRRPHCDECSKQLVE